MLNWGPLNDFGGDLSRFSFSPQFLLSCDLDCPLFPTLIATSLWLGGGVVVRIGTCRPRSVHFILPLP